MTIAVGDAIPSGSLQENSPGTRHDPAEIFATGKHVRFGLPGAFTPGCSKTHLPGHVGSHAAWTATGARRWSRR